MTNESCWPCPDERMRARTANLAFWLFAIGAAVGLIEALSRPVDFGAGFEMVSIANNFAEHGSFGHPFEVQDTGATAVEPPIYPLAVGSLVRVVRNPAAVLLLVAFANVIVNAFVAAWLPRASLLFMSSPVPGAVASLLWLCSVRLMPAWDTSYTVAGLLLFCLLSPRWSQRLSGAPFALLGGTIVGLLFLLNNSSIMVSMPWMVWLAYHRGMPVRRAVLQTGMVCISFAAVISPWILRNYLVLGAPVLRTNLGMTAHASLNDCAEPLLEQELASGCYGATHPNVSKAEAHLLATLGEVKYDRRASQIAANWIRENPRRFQHLVGQRFREFWFPRSGKTQLEIVIIWLATALSIPGLALMIFRREPIALFFTAVLLVYPLMYYIVVSDVRYRYPILWVTYLCAAYLVGTVRGQGKRADS